VKIKALSVKQPWAQLIADGRKTIETRSWQTDYRGPLLICAAKNPLIEPFPSGVAVAVAELTECRPMELKDDRAACVDWRQGLFSWSLSVVTPILDFPVKGRQGLFEVDLSGEEVLTKELFQFGTVSVRRKLLEITRCSDCGCNSPVWDYVRFAPSPPAAVVFLICLKCGKVLVGGAECGD